MTDNGIAARGLQTGDISRSGAIALFLLAAAIILGGALPIYRHYADGIIAGTEADLLAVSRAKKREIENELRERFGDAEVMARRASVLNTVNQDPRPVVASAFDQPLPEAIEHTKEVYGYRRIAIFGTNGRLLAPRDAGSFELAVRSAVDATLATNRPQLVDAHRNAANEVMYGIVQPIREQGRGSGAALGAVYLEIDAETHLFPTVAEWPSVPSRTGETILTRREGGDVLFISAPRLEPGAPPLSKRIPGGDSRLLANRALDALPGIIHGAVDYRGQPVLGAAVRIAGTPWLLLTKIDAAEADAPLRELKNAAILSVALLIVMSAALSYLFWLSERRTWVAREGSLALRLRTAVETTRDGYLRLDEQGRILEANDLACAMTGYSREELLGMATEDIEASVPRKEMPENRRAFQAAGGGRFQTRWRRKDGSLLDVDINASFVRDASGAYSFAYARDVTETLEQARRLKRLNEYYAFLTQVDRAISQLRDPGEILETLCRGAVEEGGFLLAWAGIVNETAGAVDIAAVFGAAADYARKLRITLDPALETSHGPTGTAIREGRIIATNDFFNDPRTAAWHELAREHGIRASAVIPVKVDGRTQGALNFYSGLPGYFDDEMLKLLEETARNAGLAWEAGKAARERNLERVQRAASEVRFERIFDSSPLPKQVHSLADGSLTAINDAHERLFGYALDEIRGPDAWFQRAFPDPAYRESLHAIWAQAVAKARASGAPEESPELQIRCKDGTDRVVRGRLAVVGEDVIAAWIDLSDVRRSEAELRESEVRFRGMVEQMVAGFYVVQDDHIVYVNPRMEQIGGWSAKELVGRDPMEFVVPEDHALVLAKRAEATAARGSTSYRARVRHKSGSILVLGVVVSIGRWGDRAALVVLVEDITEQAAVEARAERYLQRLEASMRNTLHSVSRMVELRDPYTAGHELRVGQIAGAIARELGWAEERCGSLELVGLVHDIGKISVPAEILAKPTRLTKAEYEIIKGHAQAGYEIIKEVEFDGMPVAEIVRQHHERMDGSGYPQGLKGEAILPEARVLAVADVIESMSSHRPYRPSLGIEAALEELEKNRGKLYDAAVVDALQRLVRLRNYVLPK